MEGQSLATESLELFDATFGVAGLADDVSAE
jgi:hypothetical protein